MTYFDKAFKRAFNQIMRSILISGTSGLSNSRLALWWLGSDPVLPQQGDAEKKGMQEKGPLPSATSTLPWRQHLCPTVLAPATQNTNVLPAPFPEDILSESLSRAPGYR